MDEVVLKKDELMIKAKSIAKSMLNKGKEEVEKMLPEYLSNNTPLGIAICKELIETVKESSKGKTENQAAFIALCDNVIESCEAALNDGKITDEERMIIQERINEVLKMADESNKEYQKHKRDIVIAGVGGLTILGIVGIIASALTKVKK